MIKAKTSSLIFILLFTSLAMAQDYRLNDLVLHQGDAIHLSIYDRGMAPTNDQFISNYHDKIFAISGFGEIDLFTLGRVKVADLTTQEITALLNEIFKPYVHEAMIIVRPLVRITLRGDFGNPGMYRFSLDISFWDMVRTAGGLVGGVDASSALESMFIMRRDEIIYKDFLDAIHEGTSLFDLGLESGDEIVLPRANRPTFRSMLQYFQFGMNLIVLYLTLLNQK